MKFSLTINKSGTVFGSISTVTYIETNCYLHLEILDEFMFGICYTADLKSFIFILLLLCSKLRT